MCKAEYYLVLDPDGHLHWIQVPDRRQLVASFRKAIGTEWLEHVSLPYGLSCVVDEVGRIKDPPQPFNPLASRFYPGTPFGDPLVGPVVFCRVDLVDGEYDWTTLRDEDLARISLITGKPIPELFTPGVDDVPYGEL